MNTTSYRPIPLRLMLFAASLWGLACGGDGAAAPTDPSDARSSSPPEALDGEDDGDDAPGGRAGVGEGRSAAESDEHDRPSARDMNGSATTAVDAGSRDAHPAPSTAEPGASAAETQRTPSAADASAESAPPAETADSGADMPRATSPDAMERAYAALTLGQVSAVDELIAQLDDQLQQHPDDGRAHLYAGTFRLWKVSEATRNIGDLLTSLSVPEEILTHLKRARELMPHDFRVPGFYGLAQVALSSLAGDDSLLLAGQQTLHEAVEQLPAYGYFLRATALSGQAKDGPLFAQALRDIDDLTRECLYPEGAGDVAFVYPSEPSPMPRPYVCTNDGIVPHVWEGTFISFGDMVAKSGDAERARALYRSVRTSPNYDQWPFADVLERRIASADERVRLHRDDDPFNDPPLWSTEGHVCIGCHQER